VLYFCTRLLYLLDGVNVLISKAGISRSIKLANLFRHGLVSEDNRLMKSLNHDTCHFSRHDWDVKKWQTIRTPTLLCCFIFWLRNNVKSGPYGSAVGYSTGKQFAGCTLISSADCLWKLNHALEVGQLYRSSDASLRNVFPLEMFVHL